MKLYARQGDLVIEQLDTIAGELLPTKRVVFAGDSSGHPHTLVGAIKMRRDGRRTFVELAEPAQLTHGKPGGHRTVTLGAGKYEVRPLRERGDGFDRAVED